MSISILCRSVRLSFSSADYADYKECLVGLGPVYWRGKFTLIDQSSNGTLIKSRGKKSLLLKREEIQLLGSGVIGLGRDVTLEPETAIHYTIKSY